MSYPNKLITIEGLSGTGKSTISRLLAEALDALYYKTPPELFEPIREHVERTASPLARHFYFYAGIAQASADISSLLQSRTVICDKYVVTMSAYSRAMGVTVEHPSAGMILQPDATFVLEVPDELRLERVALSGKATNKHRAFLRMERELDVASLLRQSGAVIVDNSAPDAQVAVAIILGHIRTTASPAKCTHR